MKPITVKLINGLPAAADVRRPVRLGLAAIALAFAGGGSWAALAPLASAVIAAGVVKVENNRRTVQHLEGGIVKDILVKDGDQVMRGQPLLVLEDERVSAGLDLIRNQLDAETAKAARLQAESSGSSAPAFPAALTERRADAETGEIIKLERELFQTRRQVLEQQIALLEEQIVQAAGEVDALQQQLAAEQTAAALLAEELAANEALRNYATKVQILDLKRALAGYQARQGEHRAEIAKAQQRAGEIRLRIEALRNQYRQGAADELSLTRNRMFDLQERLRPLRDAARRQLISAPIGGRIVGLRVSTVGGVIRPGEALLDIVPDDEPLIIEAHIDVDDIDSVYPGLAADIRLTAYQQRTTPLLHGRLESVSADQLAQPGETPYYSARIRVEAGTLQTAAAALQLYPGMRAEVFLKTGKRTALDYLLAPVTGSLRRAARES
jgi:HlyD family type I secretion membrane fusion protein